VPHLLRLAAVAGQAFVLARIAGLGPGATCALVGAAAGLGALLLTAARRRPVSLGMPLAMLTVGGLGMALGGWLDLQVARIWCTAEIGPHPGHALVSWMNAGMLGLGLPAMRALGRAVARPACGASDLLLAAPCMVLGMTLGGQLACALAAGAGPLPHVLADHAGMSAGMLLGMEVVRLPSWAARHAPLRAASRPRSAW
jgi:hypothetical protein